MIFRRLEITDEPVPATEPLSGKLRLRDDLADGGFNTHEEIDMLNDLSVSVLPSDTPARAEWRQRMGTESAKASAEPSIDVWCVAPSHPVESTPFAEAHP